jgi:hypothetical protein
VIELAHVKDKTVEGVKFVVQYAYDAAAKTSSVNTLNGESILITLKPVKCGITEEHQGTCYFNSLVSNNELKSTHIVDTVDFFYWII